MNEIVAAIRALLGSTWPVWDTDATGANKHPYLLLLPPAAGVDPETTLGGPRTALSGDLMVRAVGLSADAVRGVLARTRVSLTNEGRPVTFDTATHRATLRLEPGRAQVLVDRDVTLTGTNVHPMFATDTYTLTAVPLT